MLDKEILIAATILKTCDTNQKVVLSPSVIFTALNIGNCTDDSDDEAKIINMIYSICMVISKEKPLPHLFFDKMKESGNHLLSVDFQNPDEASKMINSFIFHQTKKMFQNLVYVNELKKDISCLIGSASTFKEEWDYPFEKTVLSTFYSNPPKQIQFICQKEGFPWNITERKDWKCLTIPYRNRRRLHICLPKEKDTGLQNLIKNFDKSLICCNKGGLMEVNAKIPVIDIETRINLKDKDVPLSSGFPTFDTQILSLHTAKFMINEYGTNANAFKDDGARCAGIFDLSDFIADYPFLFFVTYRDNQKQLSIQFIGIFA